MIDVGAILSASPWLALVGLVLVLMIIFAPAALALAGLTGAQIVALLRDTMKFVLATIKECRKKE